MSSSIKSLENTPTLSHKIKFTTKTRVLAYICYPFNPKHQAKTHPIRAIFRLCGKVVVNFGIMWENVGASVFI